MNNIKILYKIMKKTRASIKAVRKIRFNLEKAQDVKGGWSFY